MHKQRSFTYACKICSRHRIEIEMQVVRPGGVITTSVPLIKIYATEVDDPEKGRQILYYREVNYIAGRMANGADLDPTRSRTWCSLHKKELARSSVWITFHYHGPVP